MKIFEHRPQRVLLSGELVVNLCLFAWLQSGERRLWPVRFGAVYPQFVFRKNAVLQRYGVC